MDEFDKRIIEKAKFVVRYSFLPPEVLDYLFKKEFNITSKEFADEYQIWKKERLNESTTTK